MKIVYHHRTRGDGAEGIHIREMIQAFENQGHAVRLVCPMHSQRELGISLGMTGVTLKETKSSTGFIKLIVKQSAELLYNAISFCRLFWWILQFRPDLVYERYSCYHFGGLAACRLLNVPVVLEVNSTYAGRFARRQLAFPRLCRWIEDWGLRTSALVCVVSEPLRNCVADRSIPSNRVLVTPNAINPNQLIHVHQIRDLVRNELRIAQDAVVFGFVGSLRRWHGIEFLAEAVPDVIQKCPNSIFLIVGTGEIENEFKLAIQEQSLEQYVRFTGGIAYEKVPRYISAIDIGLMPDSNSWGSPMKILEYMLQGKVVVAPRIEPILEIVTHGETGILFNRLDSTDFLTALTFLAHNSELRKGIGQNAQDYVLTQRTWAGNAKHVLDTFHKIRSASNGTPISHQMHM